MLNVESFIANYTPADRDRLAFASNGKVGSELRDENRTLRTEIAKSLIQSPETASDDLIRDLYDAETSYSKAAFGVYHQFVSCLATQLLERGGEINLSLLGMRFSRTGCILVVAMRYINTRSTTSSDCDC
jgi:hypothetical protein